MKQVWSGPDTVYEVFVQCFNQTNASVTVAVYQISRSGVPVVLERLSPALIRIPPNDGFQILGGQLRTTEVENMDVLLVTGYGGNSNGATAYWDDFAITELLP